MASTNPTDESALLTLPLDLLKTITNELEPTDETNLKATCKRMNLLIAEPPVPAAAETAPTAAISSSAGDSSSSFLSVGAASQPPRDGRSTPVPQSPLPFKAAQTLAELEQENREVEDRERERGMELSDVEDGDADDGRSVASSSLGGVGGAARNHARPTKFRGKNIASWQAGLGSAPASPGASSFVHSPRAASPSPRMPSFTVTSS